MLSCHHRAALCAFFPLCLGIAGARAQTKALPALVTPFAKSSQMVAPQTKEIPLVKAPDRSQLRGAQSDYASFGDVEIDESRAKDFSDLINSKRLKTQIESLDGALGYRKGGLGFYRVGYESIGDRNNGTVRVTVTIVAQDGDRTILASGESVQRWRDGVFLYQTPIPNDSNADSREQPRPENLQPTSFSALTIPRFYQALNCAPNPNPDSKRDKSEDKPKSAPSPKPERAPEPKPEPRRAPSPEPERAPEPQPERRPEPERQPEPRRTSEPERQPEPRRTSEPERQPEPRRAPAPQPQRAPDPFPPDEPQRTPPTLRPPVTRAPNPAPPAQSGSRAPNPNPPVRNGGTAPDPNPPTRNGITAPDPNPPTRNRGGYRGSRPPRRPVWNDPFGRYPYPVPYPYPYPVPYPAPYPAPYPVPYPEPRPYPYPDPTAVYGAREGARQAFDYALVQARVEAENDLANQLFGQDEREPLEQNER